MGLINDDDSISFDQLAAQTNPYETARDAYWAAQGELRAAGIVEIQRLMPEGMDRLTFEMTDGTPSRLTLTSDADEILDDDTWAEIDEIASCMDFVDYDEVKSWLMRIDDGFGVFVIDRPVVA